MKMLRASRLRGPALGALAVTATAGALFRSRRSPSTESTDPISDGPEPDVLLDVTELRVDRINLEVDDLKAHVAIVAALANLVDLSVGVDARLTGVKLEIEGVEAKAVLKARLENVRAILEKALDTIGEHPEVLETLGRSLDRAVRESLGEAQATLSEVLQGIQTGDTVDEALRARLDEVRANLDKILERPEVGRGGEGAGRRALGGGSRNTAPSDAQQS